MSKNTTSSGAAEISFSESLAHDFFDISSKDLSPSMNNLVDLLASRLNLDATLAQALLKGFQALLDYAHREFTPQTSALDEERTSVQSALAAVRPLFEARLQRQIDQLDEKQEEVKCLNCAKASASQGRRKRRWRSTVGAIELKRRYSWCADCKKGRSPAQERVGLPKGDYTAGLEEIATLMATTVAHDMAVSLLEQMLGVELSSQGVKSATARRGEQVKKLLCEEAEEIKDFEEKWLISPPYITEQAGNKSIKVAYLEVDGVHVLTRREDGSIVSSGGRGGPGRKYEVRGREVKNAVLYEAEAVAQESERRKVILEKSYVSHLGDWLTLARLIWCQMLKMGFDRANRLVVLSDGAEWIRSLCEWLPVKVILILDLYHVKHRIWEVGAILFGEGSEACKQWSEEQCKQIEEGKAEEVIERLEQLNRSQRKAREQIERLESYLRNNLDRMDYPRYRGEGLRVGSGVVESTNYHVTGARLKLAGMRWSEEGAGQMSSLRADLFNGVWRERSQQLLKAA